MPNGTSDVSEKQLCSEGSTGGNRLYTLNRRRAKKLIPVNILACQSDLNVDVTTGASASWRLLPPTQMSSVEERARPGRRRNGHTRP